MADKELQETSSRMVWAVLGHFRPADVPLLFPRVQDGRHTWGPAMRAAICTRVSTAEQNPELQFREIQW